MWRTAGRAGGLGGWEGWGGKGVGWAGGRMTTNRRQADIDRAASARASGHVCERATVGGSAGGRGRRHGERRGGQLR